MKENINERYNSFVKAASCKATLQTFGNLCKAIEIEHPPSHNENYDHCTFYQRFREELTSFWNAQSLFSKLDKKYFSPVYDIPNTNGSKIAKDTKVLIIGAGPCGLRMAIEMALLGAKTVVVEKRDSFSRNNVLHLWPFTIEDLRMLGAKKFNGRFCSGAIDHVSIRQLQLILLKAALIFGVDVQVNTSFVDVVEPTEVNGVVRGWTAKILPATSPITNFEFDVVIGADGRQNTLKGFDKKVFRASLALGITANFINRHTTEEAKVSEISGINFIYRQQFFRDLSIKHGIDLENIVYYKDDTHYFVMTAKKHSLLARGVLVENLEDARDLLSPKNIDKTALLKYALDAVNFSTNNKIPNLEVAINNYGLPDIAIFDFTRMQSSVNATMFRESKGRKLLAGLVGDGLLEPFWPLGTGIAKGFLSIFDTAWMIKQWISQPKNDSDLELSLLAEREGIYRTLAQIKSARLLQNWSAFTLNPKSRYQSVPMKLKIDDIRCFYFKCDEQLQIEPNTKAKEETKTSLPSMLTRNVSLVRTNSLLKWCQSVINKHTKLVKVADMSSSWRNGIALCCLINCYRPDLIKIEDLSPDNVEYNNQMAFDIAEQHLGVTPVMSGKEMSEHDEVDSLLMVTYISQFYEIFKHERPVIITKTKDAKSDTSILGKDPSPSTSSKEKWTKAVSSTSPVGLLTRFSNHIKRKTITRGSSKEYSFEENDTKRKRLSDKIQADIAEESNEVKLTKVASSPMEEDKENKVVMRNKGNKEIGMQKFAGNRISALGLQLISQWEQSSPSLQKHEIKANASNVCCFCSERVYIVEKLSVEGLFFHRQCFKCSQCGVNLRAMNYRRDSDTGKFYCDVHFYTNVEFLKPASCLSTVKVTEISQEEAVADDSDDNIDWNQLNATGGIPENMVATIERGKIVMKRDVTPKRAEMENARLSMLGPSEVPEEFLNQHNLSMMSDHSDSDDSSDSEEWNELTKKTLNNPDKSAHDVLVEYQTQMSETKSPDATNTTDLTNATLLSSASDGDSQVSSITSSSEEDDCIEEYNNDDAMSTASSVSSEQKDVDMLTEEPSVVHHPSSQSKDEVASVTQEKEVANFVREVTITTVLEKQDEKNASHEKLNNPSTKAEHSFPEEATAAKDKKDDTIGRSESLDEFQKYLQENPIDDHVSEAHSPGQSPARSNLSHSKSTDEISLSSVSSVSSHVTEEQISAAAVELTANAEINSTSGEHHTFSCGSRNNTSIWTNMDENVLCDDKSLNNGKDSSDICMEKSSDKDPKEKSKLPLPEFSKEDSASSHNDQKPKLRYSCSLSSTSSKSSENDEFFTPTAATPKPRESDSYYSVQDTISFSDTSVLEKSLECTPRNSGLDSSDITEYHSEISSPGSETTQSPRKKRLLPIIPKIKHLEAMSPTSSSPSESSIDYQLKKHEEKVQARVRKMKMQAALNKGELENPNLSPNMLPKKRQLPKLKSTPTESQTPSKEDHKKFFKFSRKKKRSKLKSKSPASTFYTLSPNVSTSFNTSSEEISSNAFSRRHNLLASYTPEEIENRINRRVRIAAQKQAQQAEQKRHARALVIQSQLEEVDVKQKLLEKRGVELEKVLRSEKSRPGSKLKDNSAHMHDWFKLVQEKNALLRYENELMIYQRELQLEDRQSQLQQELRERMAVMDSKKSAEDLAKEKAILSEMLDVVEQRDELVALLDEQRVKDKEENADIEGLLMEKFSKLSSTEAESYLSAI